jgi:hypothetical protein
MRIRLAHRSDSINPGAIAVDFDAGSFLQIVTMVILILNTGHAKLNLTSLM